MISSAQLLAAMTALETAAGATTAANDNESGRWKRIAAASETLAGATSSANVGTAGYMLRTAVALEAVSSTTTPTANRNESGLLLRIVNALEALGSVGAGSLGHRFVLAAEGATFGPDFNDLTLDNDTIAEDAADAAIVGNIVGLLGSPWQVNLLSQNPALWFYLEDDALIVRTDYGGLDYETSASPTVTLRECDNGELDINNPVGPYHDTVLTIHVTDVAEELNPDAAFATGTTGWDTNDSGIVAISAGSVVFTDADATTQFYPKGANATAFVAAIPNSTELVVRCTFSSLALGPPRCRLKGGTIVALTDMGGGVWQGTVTSGTSSLATATNISGNNTDGLNATMTQWSVKTA